MYGYLDESGAPGAANNPNDFLVASLVVFLDQKSAENCICAVAIRYKLQVYNHHRQEKPKARSCLVQQISRAINPGNRHQFQQGQDMLRLQSHLTGITSRLCRHIKYGAPQIRPKTIAPLLKSSWYLSKSKQNNKKDPLNEDFLGAVTCNGFCPKGRYHLR